MDTNILVRLITNDVPELAKKAIELIEAADKLEILVLDAVITEACFVLEFNPAYKLDRATIYDGIHTIIDHPNVTINPNTEKALEIYATQKDLDYVDCLLLTATKKRDDILTFDKNLLRSAK